MRCGLILLTFAFAFNANAQLSLDKLPATVSLDAEASSILKYPLLQQSKAPVRSILQENVLRLPQGIHAHTAFFCKIEDAIAKQNKVNFKFRLGSVDYVDAMEGKGYFQAVSYSRASNVAMQYQQKK